MQVELLICGGSPPGRDRAVLNLVARHIAFVHQCVLNYVCRCVSIEF